VGFLKSAQRLQEAVEIYYRAVELHEKLAEKCPTVAYYRNALVDYRNNLASLLRSLGRVEEVEKVYRQAVSFWEKIASDFPVCRLELAHSYRDLGNFLRDVKHLQEAEEAYGKAVKILQEDLVTEFPKDSDNRQRVVDTYTTLASLLKMLGRNEQAEKVYRQALVLTQKLAAEDPKGAASAYFGFGWAYSHAANWKGAVEAYKEATELDPKLAAAHNNLAWLLSTCADPHFRDPRRAVEYARKPFSWHPPQA
jgi:tetratricopeptide (TPR) repeat protein